MLDLRKNHLHILLIAAMLSLGTLACGDDDDDSNHGGGTLAADAYSDVDASNDALSDASTDAGEDISEEEPCLTPRTRRQLELTNEARAEEGLGALECDKGLTQSAYLHAKDMCELDYFSHDSQDGRDLSDRVNAQNVQWTTIGENIAYGQFSPEDVHEAWMDSPGHRANILTEGFGRLGVGYYLCEGYPYWVQNFAN